MTINLITTEEHKLLHDIFTNYPALTLQNKGYEYIHKSKLTDEERERFKEVAAVLSKSVHDFSEFNNFRLSPCGQVQIRLQYHYSSSFTGVGYLLLDELLNGFNEIETSSI